MMIEAEVVAMQLLEGDGTEAASRGWKRQRADSSPELQKGCILASTLVSALEDLSQTSDLQNSKTQICIATLNGWQCVTAETGNQ